SNRPVSGVRGIPFVIAGGEVTSFHLSVRSGSLIPRESPAAAGVVGTVPTGAGASAKFEFDRGQRLMVRMTRTAATRAMTTQIPPWRMRSIRSACPAAAVTLPPRPGASPTSKDSGASTSCSKSVPVVGSMMSLSDFGKRNMSNGEGARCRAPSSEPHGIRGSVVHVERPVEERSHLATGDRVVRAVTIVGRRVAPAGDVGVRDRVDGALVDVAVIVDEPVGAGSTQVEGPLHERRHLRPAQGRV